MTPLVLSHAERLAALTRLLARWQPVWKPLPFQHPELSWTAAAPAGRESLLALTDRDCERLQANPFEATPLSSWLPVGRLAGLVEFPELPGAPVDLPEIPGRHVGGRKWRQIAAFAPRILADPGLPMLEWCAGKGHLARVLALRDGAPVTALEIRGDLCAEGQALADRQGLPVDLRQQNVLEPGVERWLTDAPQIAALHACGDLHERLLRLAAGTGCAVTLAPCCYQRTSAQRYRPLSRLGQQLVTSWHLELTREDLALAVQDSVTAPRHVRRNRQRANAWRLGFDLLQRRLRGIDAYLPVPSLAYGRLPSTFEGFCRWAAERKTLELPAGIDWGSLERAGWQRVHEVARLELVRHLFRRPLEVWLLLDRALFLEEAGFCVELGIFCPREITPRNLLLRAHPGLRPPHESPPTGTASSASGSPVGSSG